MEHTENIANQAATDEPAVPSTLSHALVLPRDSDRLSETLISDAIACSGDSRPGWTQRADGWTPERIRIFLTALAQCGVVSDAARAAGMSKQSAHAFRNSAKGRAFSCGLNGGSLSAGARMATVNFVNFTRTGTVVSQYCFPPPQSFTVRL